MRLTTQIKKLAQDASLALSNGMYVGVQRRLARIIETAERIDARTGTIDPSRKKRGSKK